MALGLDRQVQERVAAYQGNPAALQKNYQMNQNLLDLLALQKIKSEKDAAKRELELSMEQNPQTISQQRGEEAIQRTKDELVKQVGGIAGQRQAVQQKNIQRAAAGASPAPPPGARPANPQQMAGIANQPAPNMARMAGGGIVNFAKGDKVKAMTPKELLASVGYTPEMFAKLSEEQKENVVKSINTSRGLNRFASDVAAPFAAAADVATMVPRMVGDVGDVISRKIGLTDAAASPLIETATPAYDYLRRVDQRNQPISMGQLQPPPAVSSKVPPPAQAQAQAQNQAIQPTTPTPPPSITPSILPPTPSNIDTARTAQRDEAAKFMGRAGIADKYKEMLAKRTALNTELNREAANDPYAALAGVTSFRDVGVNAQRLKKQRALDRERRLGGEQELEESGMSTDIDVAKTSIGSGDRAATISQAEASRLSREAVAKFNAKSRASIAEAQIKIQKESNDIKREANVGLAFDRGAKLLADIEQEIAKLVRDTIMLKGEVSENERKVIIKNARRAFISQIISLQSHQDRLALKLKLPPGKWGSKVTTKNKPKSK